MKSAVFIVLVLLVTDDSSMADDIVERWVSDPLAASASVKSFDQIENEPLLSWPVEAVLELNRTSGTAVLKVHERDNMTIDGTWISARGTFQATPQSISFVGTTIRGQQMNQEDSYYRRVFYSAGEGDLRTILDGITIRFVKTSAADSFLDSSTIAQKGSTSDKARKDRLRPCGDALKSTGKCVAILIGVGSPPGMTPLQSVAFDIKYLRETLDSNCGFSPTSIHVLTDSVKTTTAALKSALDPSHVGSLTHTLSANDGLIVYFSGHGDLETSKDSNRRRGYLYTSDGGRGAAGNLWDSTLIRLLAGIPTERLLLITDACYSGHLPVTIRDQARGNASPASARLVLMAGASDETVPASTTVSMWRGMSAFTYNLVQTLNLNKAYKQIYGTYDLYAQLRGVFVNLRDNGQSYYPLPQLEKLEVSEGDFYFY